MKKNVLPYIMAASVALASVPTPALAEEGRETSQAAPADAADMQGDAQEDEKIAYAEEDAAENADEGEVSVPALLTTTATAAETVITPDEPQPLLAVTNSSTVEYQVVGGKIYFDPSTGAITGADDTITAAHIPSLIDGVDVTRIDDWAFADCQNLTSITIPYGVTDIGYGAFSGCSGIESLVIPSSVTLIDSEAFSKCSGLKSIDLPKGIHSIYDSTFNMCSSLESITIPEGVTFIDNGAFDFCSSLTSVTIPVSVTTIGDTGEVFLYCDNLTDIYYGGSQEEWDSIDGRGVPSGSRITIHYNYQILYAVQGGYIYFNISTGKITGADKTITAANIPETINGVAVTSIGWDAFDGCEYLISITIPDSVTSIGSCAFNECSNLASVTIPNSVTSIDNQAFRRCSSLASVTIPNSVTSIGDSAFEGCSSLASITVQSTNQYYSSDEKGVLFNRDKTTLVQYPIGNMQTSYNIPNSVTSIVHHAFKGCSSLASITIPNGVTSIDEWTFGDCDNLTSITIPDSVTSIGYCAFFGCSSLASITIPNSVTVIDRGAFSDCSSLASITIPNGVTSIGYCVFSDCDSLTSITIPNSVTSIEKSAFSHCDNLASITISNSVTSIDKWAFGFCNNLTSIVMPDSVTSIGEKAFYGCDNLTDVYYSGSEADWAAIAGDGKPSGTDVTIHYNSSGPENPGSTALVFENKGKYDIPSGKKGEVYTADIALTATGGKAPYSFAIVSPVKGLSINRENKLVYTRPEKTQGLTRATIKATDAAGASKTIQVVIGEVKDADAPITAVTISFDANGGTIAGTTTQGEATITLTFDSTQKVTLPTATRSGYNFRGWFTEQNGGSQVTEDSIFTLTDGATVYARWSRKSSGGGSSSGGGGGSSTKTDTKKDTTDTTKDTTSTTPETKTVTNADGFTTTTVTNPDGSSVETTTYPNGAKTVIETDENGARVITETRADGTEIRTEISSRGNVSATVTLPEGADSTTVTIPTDSKPTAGTVAMIVKPDGSREIIMNSRASSDGVTVTLTGDATLEIVDNAKSFTDVPNSSWAKDSIDFVTARGLFSGVSDREFGHNAPMTRAMLMTVLARLDGQNTSGGSTWYEKGMAWAVAKGISDGSNPNGTITREQLAAMLYRYAGSPAASGSLDRFTDRGAISPYAVSAMRWAVEKGILSGMGDGTLHPQGNATRAQVAAMLMRYMNVMG